MNFEKSLKIPPSITYAEGILSFLDQTKLPLEIFFEEQQSVEQVYNSIKLLKVRGAPAIGIAGAYGVVIGAKKLVELKTESFFSDLKKIANYLESSRPTAVNLHWSLNRMMEIAYLSKSKKNEEIFKILENEAIAIHNEDRDLCRKIGENGVGLIKQGMGILTHCNAGSLAVSEFGTALAPLYLAHSKGVKFKVFADETRPLLQGSRLTAFELNHAGIDVTLITDNMAAHIMSTGLINMVIVGTDRVAANGDVANKIGTLSVAILARYFNIPFYVACPSSTIDLKTKCGADIEIEERDAEEICIFNGKRTAPIGIKVRNPAFDITEHHLVTGLITEKGLFKYPYDQTIRDLYSK